jgi:predicted  nucleic acid-binding Zn-ribbon protein
MSITNNSKRIGTLESRLDSLEERLDTLEEKISSVVDETDSFELPFCSNTLEERVERIEAVLEDDISSYENRKSEEYWSS